MKIVIASDFHLKFAENAEDRERRDRVTHFLRSLRGKADLLVLNGDIFDLWFVWRRVMIRGYFGVLRELADLADSGVKLVFIAGNHDFWFRDFLTRELGATVALDSFRCDADGKKLYVSHGDAYTTGDLRYQVYRRLVRNRAVMWVFNLLHPDFALKLGGLMSRSSRARKANPELARRKQAGLRRKAGELLRHGDDIVVFGHTHDPMVEQTPDGVFANSGDWISHDTYLVLENGEVTLHTYKIDE